MHQMEIDLYFEPIFWLRCRMRQKTQKPAVQNCIFCHRKLWALLTT